VESQQEHSGRPPPFTDVPTSHSIFKNPLQQQGQNTGGEKAVTKGLMGQVERLVGKFPPALCMEIPQNFVW